MRETALVSVIIPVYGVEKYIEKCIRSLLSQTFTNFEAIIVDDGSPDESINIARKVIGDDPRFIILEKKNGGLASARNYGLDHAKGEYIAFVDSDDYVEPDFLLKPYQQMIKYNADICMFGINYVDSKCKIISILNNRLNLYYIKEDFLVSKNTITQFAWSKLYKKEIWKEIRFNENVITYEDVFVTFRLVFNKNLIMIDDALYNYLQRPGSLSKDVHPTYLQDRIAIKNKQLEFSREHGIYEKRKDYIIYTYLKTFVFYCASVFARYSKNYSKDIKELKNEIDSSLFTFKNIFLVMKVEPKVGIALLIFKISPKAYRYIIKYWFRNAVA